MLPFSSSAMATAQRLSPRGCCLHDFPPHVCPKPHVGQALCVFPAGPHSIIVTTPVPALHLGVDTLVLGYSVAQLCPAFCDFMDCSTPGFPVLHYLPEFAQTNVHRVGDAIQSSHPLSPLLLLPSIFPSIRVFSNESALHLK